MVVPNPPNAYGLNWALERVRRFHLAAGHPVAEVGVALAAQRVRVRATWMREELDELESASSLVDQADAVVDLMYFALGTLVEMGVDAEAAFDIVHRANMAKVVEGDVLTRPDGKITKPSAWQTPEVELAREIVRSVSTFDLVEAPDEASASACLAMIAHAVGANDWDLERFDTFIPRDFVRGSTEQRELRLRAGSFDPLLLEAACPLSDDYVPSATVSEATFHIEIDEALATSPGVIVGFQSGQAYRSPSQSGAWGLVLRRRGSYIDIIDPRRNNEGPIAVNIDDLFAGVRSAMDGIHRICVRGGSNA